MEYSGIVYGKEPEDAFYKLSKDELGKMNLKGLPVKIEHMNTVVGHVIDSKLLDNGTLMIRYVLNKNVPGYITDQLIKDGHLTELSLSHIDNGVSKTPTEVSVVFKGARPETKILNNKNIRDIKKNYINNSKRQVNSDSNFVKASARMSSPIAEEAEAAAAKDVEMPEKPEASARDGGEPEAKRVKTDDSAEKVVDPSDRLKILEDIVSKIPDFDLKKNIYGLTSNLMSEIMEKEKLCRNKDEEIVSLSKFKETNEANTESNARSTASVIAELLQLYNPSYVKNDSLSDKFVKTMSENPQVYEFLRPIEVCASHIKAERAKINDTKKVDELEAYRKKCEHLQNQLGVYNRMGGHVMEKKPEPTSEIWKAPPVSVPEQIARREVPAHIPHHSMPPVVQVAASAGQTRKSNDIPDFLRQNLGNYNNGSFGGDRVMPGDFARPIISKAQQ